VTGCGAWVLATFGVPPGALDPLKATTGAEGRDPGRRGSSLTWMRWRTLAGRFQSEDSRVVAASSSASASSASASAWQPSSPSKNWQFAGKKPAFFH